MWNVEQRGTNCKIKPVSVNIGLGNNRAVSRMLCLSRLKNIWTTIIFPKRTLQKKLGVSKGYISQILNGNFDHKISKLIELSLAIEKAPFLKLDDLGEYILADAEGKKIASVASIGNSRKQSEIEYADPKKSLHVGKTAIKRTPVRKNAKRKEKV